MINILSYAGINLQSEVCLWCLLGLVRSIFDATLFKVNANLKQVWQMNMPVELSKPVQRALRTMVSGIMLVQCFTVYVYLASYIVLLYPVFLEERPALVLPWLLLAAVRKLLCELMSLALGLGTCLLLGPARPPCIKFVVVKFATIIPAFYMWMLVFSYYHALKVAAAFKTFPAILPPNENDYGLELAVRRRCTKSLLGEDQLRKKLVANFYGERTPSATNETFLRPTLETLSRLVNSPDTSIDEEEPEADVMKPSTAGLSDIGIYAYEDWFGNEVMIPRDTDRILEQIVLMLLRIGAYLKKEGKESIVDSQILHSSIPTPSWHQRDSIDCTAMNGDISEPPPHVCSSKGNVASYLREYPQIFMKKQATLQTVHNVETDEGTTSKNKVKHDSPSGTSYGEISPVGVEKVPSKKKIIISDSNTTSVLSEDKSVKLTLPPELQTKRMTKEQIIKSKLKKQRDADCESENDAGEMINKVMDDRQESKTSADDYRKASSDSKHSNKNKNENSSETLNNDNSKKNTYLPNVGSSKKVTENETPKEKNNDEFTLENIPVVEESLIKSNLLTSNISKKGSDITSNDKNKLNKTSNEKLLQNNNRESSNNKIFSVTSNEKFTYNYTISKAGTSIEIPKDDKDLTFCQVSNDNRIKEPPGFKILKEDSNSNLNNNIKENSDLLNFTKNNELSQENENKELTEIKTSKNDKNKELPLRILSNDDNIKDSRDVKVSNKDSSDTKISRESKNKRSSDDKMANKVESLESTTKK